VSKGFGDGVKGNWVVSKIDKAGSLKAMEYGVCDSFPGGGIAVREL
jgi:hypothetical protein